MICQALVPVICNLIETYTTHFRELNTPVLHLRARPGWRNVVLREILRMRRYGHELVGKVVGGVHLLWRKIPKRPQRSPLVHAEMPYELTGEVFFYYPERPQKEVLLVIVLHVLISYSAFVLMLQFMGCSFMFVVKENLWKPVSSNEKKS